MKTNQFNLSNSKTYKLANSNAHSNSKTGTLSDNRTHKQSNISLNNSFNKNLSHGGSLRNLRKGRSFRPLSTKEPLHLVFKINKTALTKGLRHPKNYSVIGQIFKKFLSRSWK